MWKHKQRENQEFFPRLKKRISHTKFSYLWINHRSDFPAEESHWSACRILSQSELSGFLEDLYNCLSCPLFCWNLQRNRIYWIFIEVKRKWERFSLRNWLTQFGGWQTQQVADPRKSWCCDSCPKTVGWEILFPRRGQFTFLWRLLNDLMRP